MLVFGILATGCPTGSEPEPTTVTLSGTIGTVTVNGAPPSGNIWIRALNQNEDYLGSSSAVNSESGAWSIAISLTNTALASTTSIRFQVRIEINGSYLDHDIPDVTKPYEGQSISDIALGDIAITNITLSGTIGTVTVNGAPYSGNIWIGAYNQDGNFLRSTEQINSQSGAWSMAMSLTNTALASTTSINFQVRIEINGSSLTQDIPAATKTYTQGQSISGIELGDIAITNITLSGTIGTVTVNGAPYSGNMWINAYNQDGQYLGGYNTNYSGSGAWAINIPLTNLESTTSIRFQLEINTGGSYLHPDIPDVTKPYTEGQSISNIELGNVAVTTES
jgi:hypothetical protein